MFITIHWIHCWLAFGWKWKQHRTERKHKRASEQQKLAQHRESGFGWLVRCFVGACWWCLLSGSDWLRCFPFSLPLPSLRPFSFARVSANFRSELLDFCTAARVSDLSKRTKQENFPISFAIFSRRPQLSRQMAAAAAEKSFRLLCQALIEEFRAS